MFTADMARREDDGDLDARIKDAVHNNRHGPNGAYMRVYRFDDPWFFELEWKLTERGFINIDIPDMTIKGDVYFEWPEQRP